MLIDNMLTWMFFTDSLNLASGVSLIGVLHMYMKGIADSYRLVEDNSIHKRHLDFHLRNAVIMMFTTGTWVVFKAIDSVMQLNELHCAASPMELWINVSSSFIYWGLIPVVLHLAHEQDPNHDFFILTNGERVNAKRN